jgi:hypothetical protein
VLSSFAAIFLLLKSSAALLEGATDAVTINSIKQIINNLTPSIFLTPFNYDRQNETYSENTPHQTLSSKGLWLDEQRPPSTKGHDNFLLSHVGGPSKPKLNEEPVKQPIILNHSDIIDIGSTKLQFSTKSG